MFYFSTWNVLYIVSFSKTCLNHLKNDFKVFNKWLCCLFIQFWNGGGIQLWSMRCLEVVLPTCWNLNVFFSMFEENTKVSSFVYEIVYSVNWLCESCPFFLIWQTDQKKVRTRRGYKKHVKTCYSDGSAVGNVANWVLAYVFIDFLL